jgi:hypothetical protein
MKVDLRTERIPEIIWFYDNWWFAVWQTKFIALQIINLFTKGEMILKYISYKPRNPEMYYQQNTIVMIYRSSE